MATSRRLMMFSGLVATSVLLAASTGSAFADQGNGRGARPHSGSTLYVSPHGTDTANSCTHRSNPCQTIGHAVSVAPKGATVLVEAGTYSISGSTSGGVDLFQPVTLRAEGHVVLTGSGPIFNLYNSSTPTSGVVGVRIEGFNFQDVTGSGYNGVITVPGYGAGDVTIADNTFSNTTDEAIGYHGNNGLTSPLGTNWHIVRNRISHVTSPRRSGMFLGGLSDSVIKGNIISDTGHAGIILTANGSTPPSNNDNQVRGNQVRNVPFEGIQVAFGNGILVAGNTIFNAGTAGTLPGNPAASSTSAIMLFNADQTNITVLDNSATHSFNGLAVGQPPYSGTGTMGTGIVVLHNDFADETNAGIADYAPAGSSPLNAMLNWWGCASGPNTAGCSSTVGSVDDTPWLTHPVAGLGHRR